VGERESKEVKEKGKMNKQLKTNKQKFQRYKQGEIVY
jgi:hypothetical protein